MVGGAALMSIVGLGLAEVPPAAFLMAVGAIELGAEATNLLI